MAARNRRKYNAKILAAILEIKIGVRKLGSDADHSSSTVRCSVLHVKINRVVLPPDLIRIIILRDHLVPKIVGGQVKFWLLIFHAFDPEFRPVLQPPNRRFLLSQLTLGIAQLSSFLKLQSWVTLVSIAILNRFFVYVRPELCNARLKNGALAFKLIDFLCALFRILTSNLSPGIIRASRVVSLGRLWGNDKHG